MLVVSFWKAIQNWQYRLNNGADIDTTLRQHTAQLQIAGAKKQKNIAINSVLAATVSKQTQPNMFLVLRRQKLSLKPN